MKALHST